MAFQSPQVYGAETPRASSFIGDPRATKQVGRLLGQNTVSLAGIGDYAVSNDPNDPMRQSLGGRLPNEGPNQAMGQAYLNSLQGGQQGGYAGVPGAPGMGGGGGMGGPGGQAPGGAPFGAVTPGQLGGLMGPNPTQEDMQGNQAAQLAFQEYERIPGVYQSEMGQGVGNAIQQQMSGQSNPFTPDVQSLMRGQFSDQAGAAQQARNRMIGDQGAASGLGGGGAQMGARMQSMEQGAQQRAQANTQLGITSALENSAYQERGTGKGMDWMGQQAGAMGQAAMAKGNALANYQNFGQQEASAGSGLGGALAGLWGQGGSSGGARGYNQEAEPEEDPMLAAMRKMFGLGGTGTKNPAGGTSAAAPTYKTGSANSPSSNDGDWKARRAKRDAEIDKRNTR